jgi:hypothetical protein
MRFMMYLASSDEDEVENGAGEGIEPPTFGLQNRCTTAVLTRRAPVIHDPAGEIKRRRFQAPRISSPT